MKNEQDDFDEGIDMTFSAMVGAGFIVSFLVGLGIIIGVWLI